MNLLGMRGSLGSYIKTGKYELAPDVSNIEKQMNEIIDAAREK